MKYSKFVFFAILFGYSFLYIATSKSFCDEDCEKVGLVEEGLIGKSYVNYVGRCSYSRVSDTLCVYVKDTTGVDWNHLADTTCVLAAQQGLLQQKIFILKYGTMSRDTLARKSCP